MSAICLVDGWMMDVEHKGFLQALEDTDAGWGYLQGLPFDSEQGRTLYKQWINETCRALYTLIQEYEPLETQDKEKLFSIVAVLQGTLARNPAGDKQS